MLADEICLCALPLYLPGRLVVLHTCYPVAFMHLIPLRWENLQCPNTGSNDLDNRGLRPLSAVGTVSGYRFPRGPVMTNVCFKTTSVCVT